MPLSLCVLCCFTSPIRRFFPLNRLLHDLFRTGGLVHSQQGRYILELKQHRENKLQSVNHNPFTIHQHVTSVIFQEQGETMNVDTIMLLDLSLEEAVQRKVQRNFEQEGEVSLIVKIINNHT